MTKAPKLHQRKRLPSSTFGHSHSQIASGRAGISSSFTAWKADRSGVCSSGQLITVSPITRRKLSQPRSVDVEVDVEEDDQRPEHDGEERRDDLPHRVVADVVVVPGREYADHQVDDREEAGTAAPVHASVAVGRDFAGPL